MRSRTAIDRLISRREIHLPEKMLWRMLYETCARAEELLQLSIEDLDLAGRCSSPTGGRHRHRWARSRLGLHELRHSGLTHLGESGASLIEPMAKSRHRRAENLRRYFKSSTQAMRELTSLIGPDTSRTH